MPPIAKTATACLLAFCGPAIASGEPLLDTTMAYSATSHYQSHIGGRTWKSTRSIDQSHDRVRYTNPERASDPFYIFRLDQDVIWKVFAENKFYAGVLLYQEFPLSGTRSIGDPHIDQLITVHATLASPQNLADAGQERIDGQPATHFQLRRPNLSYPDQFEQYDYWVSASGLLLKASYAGPENTRWTLENTGLRLGAQPDDRFMPPPGYSKAGMRISWKEEKQKLEAAQRQGQ